MEISGLCHIQISCRNWLALTAVLGMPEHKAFNSCTSIWTFRIWLSRLIHVYQIVRVHSSGRVGLWLTSAHTAIWAANDGLDSQGFGKTAV